MPPLTRHAVSVLVVLVAASVAGAAFANPVTVPRDRSARPAGPAKAKLRARAHGSNLLANGGFEGSLSGWTGHNASVSRVTGGAVGGYSARVALSRATNNFSLVTVGKSVSATTAAEVYSAGAAVRTSGVSRSVCLRVREWAGTTVAGSAQTCVTTATAWKRLPDLTYTTRGAGHQLDIYLFVWGSVAGDRFDADDIFLARGSITADPPPPPPPAPSPSALTATAVDHAHVSLSWPAVPGAASYRILRGGSLLGSTAGTTFVDALLWPKTPYAYSVESRDAAGAVLTTSSADVTTAAVPPTGFPRPFGATSFWNNPVASGAPTSGSNPPLMSYFVAHATNPNLSIGAWSVPVAEAHPSDQMFAVPCTLYACTLGAFGAFAIPVTAKADPSDDGHLAVYDPASNREWDFWQAKWNGTSWSASAGAAVSMAGTGVAPPNIGAGNAANFPLLGGLIRPEEIAQGHIDHALVFGISGIGAGAPVCPASHNAPTSSDPNALREGMQLQLDPTVDVNALPIPAYAKIVARAMQTYGMYLRDNAGSLGVYGENPIGRGYNPWPSVLGTSAGNEYPSLAGIPWSRFRVLAAPDYPNC